MITLYIVFSYRSAVYAVIAISRLQFITRRWHTGVRNTYHQPKPQVPNVTVTRPLPTYMLYRSGNVNVENVPVVHPSNNRPSNSAFVIQRPITPTNEDTLPWSGSTPPSRDMGLGSPNRNG